MKNIAIIGVGALGKRHLESMVNLQEKYDIYAVEINEEIIQRLSNEFPKVNFITTVEKLPEELEIAVIATNSNIRRQLFEQLINHSIVKNIIFEKVLFQKEEDYHFVNEKLTEHHINAWVNCARREWNSYTILEEELKTCNEMYISAIGGQWGIGCNGIHILDLIEYLSGNEIESIDISNLENKIIESKRKGFYEFFGSITGKCGKCKQYNLTCINNSNLPFRIEITTEKSRYLIDEGNNSLLISNNETNWQWKQKEFKQVFQSQMTERVITSIIKDGTCNLPDYESSMKLHLKYIIPLIEFFKSNGMEGNLCPIT
ncbi:Gfo/Idh/MocA family oxidoreductase [uncultured Methanobrevibacter sp.]|uniref:Gfo/Idh/MocA family oxidoreductase n=1 Tax=uncultured Methanobrevibacter sp. TaxID=253161 RepID=UPI0025DB2E5E|nr:Gfo/Idh/MocA family oxidoreductase [uncultured Methanobrevibacter sp.]